MHQYETVQFLLSQGAYIDKDSYEHVWDFVLRGKCNEMEVQALRCITESEDRNWIEEQNFPLIHMIILGLSNKPLMEELVENPDAVYAMDVQGRTALDWATARAQLQEMKLLIAHGSNLNTMDIEGRTTVLHAVDSHVEEALRIILEAGADPNPKMPEGLFRSSPLTSASFGGLAGMVRLLIFYGADIDACNPEGRTALHWVASIQNAECAHILLEHGANIDQVSSNGHTPFTTAIIYNSYTVLKLFVDQYYVGSGKGPQLLPIIAEHADVETMSILASSLVLKQCLSLSGVAAGCETLQQRKDYDERLCHAFEELCYSGPLSAPG
ncbi:ankyrin repeat-containing domain protein [Ustulina deusta]|nr:ankyrin repeat-containing domain protein [Ustulina deusta]